MTTQTPMSAETLKALRESIAHWERMRDDTLLGDEEPTGNHCALCRAFPGDCTECPVHKRTKSCCDRSPYQDAWEAWTYYGFFSDQFCSAAQAEINFLKSLLPGGEEA